jgi:hypothetical protein
MLMSKQANAQVDALNRTLTARFGGAAPVSPPPKPDPKEDKATQMKAVSEFLKVVHDRIANDVAIGNTVNIIDDPETVTWEIRISGISNPVVYELYCRATADVSRQQVPPENVQNNFKQVAGTMGWHKVRWRFHDYDPTSPGSRPYRLPELFLQLTWKRPHPRARNSDEIAAAEALHEEQMRG